MAHLAVPFLADWCTVYVLDDDGQVRRVAVACANPEHERLAEELGRFQPSPTSPNSQVAAVLASGRPELVEEIPESYVESIAQRIQGPQAARMLEPGGDGAIARPPVDRPAGDVHCLGRRVRQRNRIHVR